MSAPVANNPDAGRVLFFDTTLRDGEQSPGCTMHPTEKLRMAHQLAELGVDIMEAGFAIASHGDAESIRTIAREVRGPRIASLARAKQEDIEAAARAVEPAARSRIHLFLSSSDIHLEHQLRISRAEALDQTGTFVRLARTLVDDVEFSPMDATRTDPDYLVAMITIGVEAGATTINLPDTVGFATPAEYQALFRLVADRVPGIAKVVLSTHCHDDLGLAVANTLAGLEGGARQVECTMNGIGERAGNAALEEVAAAIMVRPDRYPYETGIRTSQLGPTSRMLTEIISFGCSPNKAIVGANAFAHEAGIHQHGVLAHPLTYEIMTPESVGAGPSQMVLGKHSGRRVLENRLTQLGFTLTRTELAEAYEHFSALADRKKSIYDEDLTKMVRAMHSSAATAQA